MQTFHLKAAAAMVSAKGMNEDTQVHIFCNEAKLGTVSEFFGSRRAETTATRTPAIASVALMS